MINYSTSCRPIQSVIILVINKSDSRCAVARFCYHSYDYTLNWTPRSPTTITKYAYRSKNLLRLNMHPQRSIPKEDTKISHCGSRSPKHIKPGHFTLLFCRGRQRNVQRFKTRVHSYCSAHQTLCLVTFPLPSPSWFAKAP